MRHLEIIRYPGLIVGKCLVGIRKRVIVGAQCFMRRDVRHQSEFFRHPPMPFGFLRVVHSPPPRKSGLFLAASIVAGLS
jgi:hypothetical protein